MANETKRSTRIASRLHEEIAFMLSRTIRDPRVRGVVISRVTMTDDLRSATCYVRLLEGADDPARRKEAVLGLTRAAAMIRSAASRNVGLRFAPELKFFYDEGLDKEMRIEQLLSEVQAEEKDREKNREKA